MGCCKRCARLTKALVWTVERTKHARQPDVNHLCQWLPARDNQASGPGPSLRSKVYAARVKTCARRNTAHPHPCCARRTSLGAGQLGQSTTSIESPKVKNPDPMLHPIQHHLALLHASSRGNDRIAGQCGHYPGGSDLLDSGG